MPQMSPMNWMLLLTMFTMIFIVCISLMYFIYLPNNLISNSNDNKIISYNSKNKFLTWKW
ncbi:ATP synthase F0 subunit 8 (mitochondrion) [Cephus cinctus]|uniref:ATP synthase F0 subunit 8 n=1 Tax=Cephus cinctus TaxID=211228 RepID=C4NCD3_CEPCN|nr:ATP synthase F0 subunit 8 [Cephus cinctus]ACJ69686.1 ATP synthase F0 subunit 8 [Cephus cinctus]